MQSLMDRVFVLIALDLADTSDLKQLGFISSIQTDYISLK